MEAARALGRLGSRDAVEPLSVALSRDPYAFVREAAAESLGMLGTTLARQALSHASQADAELRVRQAADRALLDER